MKKTFLLLFIFSNFLALSVFAQNISTSPSTQIPSPYDHQVIPPSNCQDLLDSNHYILLPKKGFALIYFFSPKNADSIKMLSLMGQLQLENKMPYFCVNAYFNDELLRTYTVTEVPSIVIIQNKKVIYATTGYVDDIAVLANILNAGIKNNLLINEGP